MLPPSGPPSVLGSGGNSTAGLCGAAAAGRGESGSSQRPTGPGSATVRPRSVPVTPRGAVGSRRRGSPSPIPTGSRSRGCAAFRQSRGETFPLPPPPTPTPTPQSPSPFAPSPLPAARGGSELRRRSAVQNNAHVSAASPFLSPLP